MSRANRVLLAATALMAVGGLLQVAAFALDRRAPGCSPTAVREAFRTRTQKLVEVDRPETRIDQWTLGMVREATPRLKTTFRLVRSYDPKLLYVDPMGFASSNSGFKGVPQEITLETELGPLPAWMSTMRTHDHTRTVGYFLTQGAEPVRAPFLAHLRSVGRGLREGVVPMRLYLVGVEAELGEEEWVEERARRWLGEAYRHHHEVCGP